MSTYMLDTDICSYIVREKPISALNNLEKHRQDLICISSITYAELIYGVEKSSSKNINHQVVQSFISRLLVLPWNIVAAEEYGQIRNVLEKRGLLIGNMDLLIAAHAKAVDAKLVTNNQKHFQRIKGLKVENWI